MFAKKTNSTAIKICFTMSPTASTTGTSQMDHLSVWLIPNLPAMFHHAITPINFFGIHKIPLIQSSHFLKCLTPDQETSAFYIIHDLWTFLFVRASAGISTTKYGAP